MRYMILAITLCLAMISSSADARLPDFTELVQDVSPAVVKINVTFNSQDRQSSSPYRGQLPDIFRELLEQQRRNQQERPQGYSMGSGFVISQDGYVLTNHHVVYSADTIKVTFSDRREYEATIVGSDRLSDLALLKIEGKNLPTLKFADHDDLRVGEWVLAIGSPFGLDYSVAAGIVSAIGRSIPTAKNETYVPFIQTDVAINPGNSGGPLFNLEGQVVGINSQIYSRSGGSIGLSFAIPSGVAQNVVDQLKETGRVDRGWLGVAIQDVDKKLAEALDLTKAQGALISGVETDSPADRGGITPGDVITEFNGKKVLDSSDLPPLVGSVIPGTSVPVQIYREGDKRELIVTVAALDSDDEIQYRKDGGDRLGLVVEEQNVSGEPNLGLQGGVRITQVSPNSAAAKAGLLPGDVIVELGQVRIRTLENYRTIVNQLPENIRVKIRLFRQGRAYYSTIQIEAK